MNEKEDYDRAYRNFMACVKHNLNEFTDYFAAQYHKAGAAMRSRNQSDLEKKLDAVRREGL